MDIEIRNLVGVDHGALFAVFNEAFSDYFIPLKYEREAFDKKLIADKVDFGLSVGAFIEDEIVGFIFHGYDYFEGKHVLYNGGTGVIAKARGNGLTKRMYAFVLPKIRERNVDELHLEVIDENVQAIKSYKAVGFETTRKVLCYSGDVEIPTVQNDLEFRAIDRLDIDQLKTFWDIHPTWQNSLHIIESIQDSFITLGAYKHDVMIGYLIYNPANNRLIQIAVDKQHRGLKTASSMIQKIVTEYGSKLSMINVDEGFILIHKTLERWGLARVLVQLEMVMKL